MTGHKSRIQRLGVYEEVVGNLRSMTSDEGFVVAQVGKVGIVLPPEVECKLAPLVGMRIGILRTDIPGKEYLVKALPEPELRHGITSTTTLNASVNEQILNFGEAI